MGFFSTPKNYLGIDIGTSSIKAVELKNEKGRPRLITYGYIESGDLLPEESEQGNKKIISCIRKVLHESKTTSTKTITALPVHSVFSSILSLPNIKRKEIAQAVLWEAKKIIPLPLEEMILDWKLLGDDEKKKSEENEDSKHIQVLLTSAPKTLVQRYISLFKEAKLNLLSLETEVFALIRSLVGNDPSIIMVIDMGARITNISVVENGIPQLTRTIETGGNDITKMISAKIGLSYEQAERFKLDLNLNGSEKSASLPDYLEIALSSVVNEIKYSYQLFESQNRNRKRIEKIILTGGSSLLQNFSVYLSSLLNIKVFIGDPWARVMYPEELRASLELIAPRFAVSIGLAMRDIE